MRLATYNFWRRRIRNLAEIVNRTLKPGSVYFFRDEMFSGLRKHFYIVININPVDEPDLILARANSGVEKIKAFRKITGCPDSTLVEISPLEYTGFWKNTIIDCNRIHKFSIDDIIRKYIRDQLEIRHDMDLWLVEKIRKGILDSFEISGEIKKRFIW